MSEMISGLGEVRRTEIARKDGKAPWSEALIGAVPFLIFGLAVIPYSLWF